MDLLSAAASAAAGAYGAYWLLRFRWALPLREQREAREAELRSWLELALRLARASGTPEHGEAFGESLEPALEEAGRLAGAELWLFERGPIGWRLLASGSRTAAPCPGGPDPAVVARFVEEGRAVELDAALGFERSPGGFFGFLESRGCGAVSVFGGRGAWLLAAAAPEPGALERARPVLSAVAAFCGERVEASRSVRELRRKERELENSMELTLSQLAQPGGELARTLVREPRGPRPILESLVAIIARALEADVCAFLLLDEEGRELVTQPGAYGIPEDEISLYRLPLSLSDSSSVRVFRTGEPLLTGDAQSDPRVIASYARLWDVRSLMVLPVADGGSALGVLRVGSRTRDRYDPEHLRYAGLFAREAAVIVESTLSAGRLGEAARRLAELNRMKDTFVSTVSHELKTPLTAIQGFLSVLLGEEAGPLNERQRRFLGIARDASRRLGRIIGELLDLSKLEGGVRMRPEPADLGLLARRSAELHGPQAAEAGVALAVAPHPPLPPVWADPGWLQQVLDNLVSNAVKYTPRGGSASIELAAEGTEVRATVSDTGVGIPLEEQGKVFERFYRVPRPDAAQPPGTGLGLAIARTVVERHGGRIWLESEPGAGSRFHFCLPQAAGPLQSPAPGADDGASEPDGTAAAA